jgi:hypothetical protein
MHLSGTYFPMDTIHYGYNYGYGHKHHGYLWMWNYVLWTQIYSYTHQLFMDNRYSLSQGTHLLKMACVMALVVTLINPCSDTLWNMQ